MSAPGPDSTASLADAPEGEESSHPLDGQAETSVATWLQTQLDREIKRLAGLGQAAVPVSVKNTGIIRERLPMGKKGDECDVVVNRVELGSSFDFSRIKQIMTSEPIACPVKDGYKLVFLVLLATLTGRAPPLIAGYVFDGRIVENDLSTWCLINNEGEAAVHHIAESAAVAEDVEEEAGSGEEEGQSKPARGKKGSGGSGKAGSKSKKR
jgi:hypothetical protein